MADENETAEIQAQLEAATKPLHELLKKQDAEIKQYGETSKETRTELKVVEEKYIALEKQLKEKTDELAAKMARPNYGGQPEGKALTPGQRFIDSEEVKSAMKSGRLETDAIEIGNLFRKAVVANSTVGDGSDRAPVYSERVQELFFDPGQRELTIRDIMNVVPTTSNAIEYFEETDAFESGSAASQDGETNTKGQMEINFEKKTATVETIAAWVPASRQVLADAPALQSHIDSRLLYKVLKEMEDQVIFGDGTSGNLLGIHNTTGVQTMSAPAGTDTVLDHIRKAFAAVRVNEYMATAIILHPNDWADIELLKGDDDHYIWTTVPNGGVPRLWRVPVVESTVMEESRFLTGAFGIGAQLWDREQATIRISEHHSDYFVRNAVAILAEMRLALTVYRPKAFIKGTFSADVST
ncbi:MAG: phage major capsid protein [Advenella sp.]